MRTYDADEIAELNADPWMLELLHKNPAYVFWGPYEDCMGDKDHRGWQSPVMVKALGMGKELARRGLFWDDDEEILPAEKDGAQ